MCFRIYYYYYFNDIFTEIINKTFLTIEIEFIWNVKKVFEKKFFQSVTIFSVTEECHTHTHTYIKLNK